MDVPALWELAGQGEWCPPEPMPRPPRAPRVRRVGPRPPTWRERLEAFRDRLWLDLSDLFGCLDDEQENDRRLVVELCTELDAWWRDNGRRWTKVYALVHHRGWDADDVLGEIRATLIHRQDRKWRSRFDPTRSTMAAYVGVVARSRVLHLLQRRVDVVLDYDGDRDTDYDLWVDDDTDDEAIGLGRIPRLQHFSSDDETKAPRERPPAIVVRRRG